MKAILNKFVKTCPKSGRIRKIVLPKGYYRLLFPVVGFAALLWILIRVIPRPSRAAYPCMKVATPLASSFVFWVIGLTASVKAFAKMKLAYVNANYTKASLFLVLGVVLGIFAVSQNGMETFAGSQDGYAYVQAELEPNQPMGQAVGIFPGRVVWVHNPDATNENCDPMEEGNSYFEPKNNDQEVIDQMLSDAIQALTGTVSDTEAWDAIFKFHNNTRGKGEVGYQSGEKVFIKMNATSGWSGNYKDSDLSKVYTSWWGGVNRYYGLSETSPAFILSVLRQLVNTAGISQEDIYLSLIHI